MSDQEHDEATDAFISKMSTYWESLGLAPSAGAILGHLMVCEPAAQTQAQLASALGLSAGSVSGQLGMLGQVGLVERVRVRGDRVARYQLPHNMWTHLVLSEGERIRGLREFAQAAAALKPTTRTDRITSLDLVVRFWETEWPLVERRFEEFIREDTP